ncbi:NF-kappa-B inhibitor-like protein 1 isoform 1-T1 [Vipera latastei]
MALRYQRRLWRYVERGRRHKLRRLLRHHRKVLDLGETKGHRNHTPLHRCCALLDHKAAILLLKYGADPSLPDHRGDTALHLAARHVAHGGDRVYEDLFVPLRIHCPSAMSIKNKAGKTPGDLLNTAAEEKWCPKETLEENEAEHEAEREWRYKLLNEWEDEFQETPWQHEEDFSTGPNSETFEEWADRLHREYRQKRRQEEEQRHRRPKKEAPKSSIQLQHFLEQEHLEYLKRAQAKEEEVQSAKRRRYEEGCSRVFSSDSSRPLSYKDIPWPSSTGTPEEMAAAALRGVDPSDKRAYRRFLRRQQALWHPDKFVQRCGTRLAEQDRHQILDTVTALSQAFNSLAEAAK